MRELKYMTIMPNDLYFVWQCNLWLESLKNIGQSDKAIVLIFVPRGREEHRERFQKVMDLYPEAEFKFYKDEHNVTDLLGVYIPILRPYTAWRYWTDFPDIENNSVFYCDSDILFTERFSLDKFLEDDIIYGSDTNSYINASYFDSKVRDVLPNKLEKYKTIDVLNEAAKIVGITREICEKNNMDSIGTQYLLKNIDADFWQNVLDKCIPLLLYLKNINKEYFQSESKGFQAWTADMWLVLWELWRRGQQTKVVKELDFAWATDPISRIGEVGIFHNAGVTGNVQDGMPFFYKGKYINGTTPFSDPYLTVILNDEKSQQKCTWWYTMKIRKLGEKYNLT